MWVPSCWLSQTWPQYYYGTAYILDWLKVPDAAPLQLDSSKPEFQTSNHCAGTHQFASRACPRCLSEAAYHHMHELGQKNEHFGIRLSASEVRQIVFEKKIKRNLLTLSFVIARATSGPAVMKSITHSRIREDPKHDDFFIPFDWTGFKWRLPQSVGQGNRLKKWSHKHTWN